MTKNVQVYFHTEDEAEQLRATLSKFTASNIIVDRLESQDNDGRLVVPHVPLEAGGANTANTGQGSHAIGYQEITKKDENPRDTVITFDIAEEDLNEVLVEVQKIGGHVDRALFD